MAHAGQAHLEVAYLRRMEEAGLLRKDDLGPVLRHVAELCPVCAAVLAAWRGSRPRRFTVPDYRASFAKLRALVCAAAVSDEDRRDDERRAAELLALSPEKQQERIERDPHLARPGVANALLAQARAALAAADPRAGSIAELAELVAHRLPRATYRQAVQLDFLAEAQLLAAQVHLARGDLANALPIVGLAEALVEHGAGSPLVWAEAHATAGLLAMAFDDRAASLLAWAEVEKLAQDIKDPVLLRQARQAEAWVRDGSVPSPGPVTASTEPPPHWIAVLQGLERHRAVQARPEAVH